MVSASTPKTRFTTPAEHNVGVHPEEPMFNASRAVTIADLRNLARRRLPEFAFVPMETGSGDGSGPARNLQALNEYLLGARALVDVTQTEQKVTVFGQTYSSAFGISAVGYAGNLRHGADELLAEAAAAANIPFMLSGGSSASIETIARIAPKHVWQQLYAARDPKLTEHFIGRARDAGVTVLVYTADSPLPPRNEWLVRRGIRLPTAVRPSSWPYVAWQALTHPAWTFEHVSQGGLPRMESWAPYAPEGAGTATIAKAFQQQVPNIKTWSEVDRVRRLWPGKLVVKGIVDAEDARRSVEAGADAVTVSNHGGNKLDCMAASIDFLPGVVSAIGSGAPVFFDGGIRRGSDILTACALGAQFCFVGRATLYGVIAGGRAGAAHAIDILHNEITRTLTLIGCPSVSEMGPQFLARSPRRTEMGLQFLTGSAR